MQIQPIQPLLKNVRPQSLSTVMLTTHVNGSAANVLKTHAGHTVTVTVVRKVLMVVGIVAVTLQLLMKVCIYRIFFFLLNLCFTRTDILLPG